MASEGAPPNRREDVVLSSKIYDLDTVKKAAYRFIDRVTVDFAVEGENVVCTFVFHGQTSPAGAQAVLQEFKAELLDQDLRRKIASETAPLRNAILALAFAASKPQKHE